MSEVKQPQTVAGDRSTWLGRLKQRFPILNKKRGKLLVAALLILPLLALLALLVLRNRGGDGSGSSSGSGSNALITDDTHFYGQSEPVYPSPKGSGTGNWADSYKKATDFVNQLTTEEKVGLASGVSSSTGTTGTLNGCSGNIAAIDRLGFPGLCLTDAGQGVRATDFVSGYPSGIHVGASWNRNLARSRAESMGLEFRVKGANMALGPVVGPIGRVVRGGRNWEGFAVDPYLCGALAAETVTGIQSQGVITSTKHFIGNEQETNRQPHDDVESVSSNIDDKTMHEMYLWPFQDAVYAGSGNIMCSYNRVNDSYACANSKTQNGLLKTELGFQGAVTSDWDALHAGVASANAGMDMVMPNSDLWGDKLVEAVKNGSVSEDRLDDMATRIIASWYQMGQDQGFPEPGVGIAPDLTKPHRIIDARNSSSKQVLLDGAIEGHVLLKNINNTLPLKKPKMLSVFGYSVRSPDQWNYKSNGGVAAWTFGGESEYLGRDTSAGFSGEWANGDFSQIAPNGTLFSGGGSGAVTPASVSSPYDALTQRAYDDDTAMMWDFFSPEPDVASVSDACLVIVNAYASEGFDRPGLRDDFTDGLITHVANQCNNTIVVFHNAGPRLVDQWIDHANVTALLFAHLPGQASGRALVDLLYGDATPSGKLPYTVARNESDYGVLLAPDLPMDEFKRFPQSNFSDSGVYLDYRDFDRRNVTPRFEFGFGLSYTRFTYDNLQVTRNGSAEGNRSTDPYPTGDIAPGGQTDLWDVLATVSAEVTNTGEVTGAEVAQLYVGIPGDDVPVRQLRGFAKPTLNATDSATVEFPLTRRDLSVWDVEAQKWRLEPGEYGIWVGASSRDLPLKGSLTI
ncbi:glycoside hydrolase family 3 protein [Xylariomycetidae sp. FL0641]|nr:glycoside hydrolase family 3 protein [Xylariomycetidae sp. FL0641]